METNKHKNKMETQTYNEAIDDVHSILADFYDEELERNHTNAVRNVSRTIRELRERVEDLKKVELK